jgi:REP element-mobilizing transposase RayT
MGEIQKYHRHSIRLPGYDYASLGDYYITICTNNRKPIFGTIVDGQMHLNRLGEIARDQWFATQKIRGHVFLYKDEFVVMPNHIHGIIHIDDGGPKLSNGHVGAQRRCAPTPDHVINVVPHSLGAIVRGYKSAVSHEIHELLRSRENTIWQRNYYESIITSDEDYARIAVYIEFNPKNWSTDAENPELSAKKLN